jgi:UDP-glucuronate decarboxylase
MVLMNILVTGGTGLIGAQLCYTLIQQGHTVFCLDNFSSSHKVSVLDLLSHPEFHLINHDIITPYFPETSIDCIYHLACPASPFRYQKNSINTIKTNVIGSMNALGIAKHHKARILLSSTSEVYGSPEVHPQNEAYWGHVNPHGIRSCYNEGKRLAESLFFEYHRHHGVEIRIARIFNTYGPNMLANDGRVVSNFIVEALKNRPLKIYGDGRQTRCFMHVRDCVKGLLSLMNHHTLLGPVNIGSDKEITVLDLAMMVQSIVNPELEIVFSEGILDDPTRRRPDLTLAKKMLQWEAKIPLSEGLAETIDSFKHLLNNEIFV